MDCFDGWYAIDYLQAQHPMHRMNACKLLLAIHACMHVHKI